MSQSVLASSVLFKYSFEAPLKSFLLYICLLMYYCLWFTPGQSPAPVCVLCSFPRVWGGTQVKLSAPAPSLHKLAWLHCRSHCLSSSRQSIQIARWSRSRGSRPVNTVRDNRNMQDKIIQRREVERGATWLCVVYLLCTWLVQFVV